MPIDTTLTEQKIQRVLGGFIASPKYRVDGLFVFGWESDKAGIIRTGLRSISNVDRTKKQKPSDWMV